MTQDLAKTSGTNGATASTRMESFEARAISELKMYGVITLYLWFFFFLFSLYKRMLLQENGISLWSESFAIVNALIFGKVILIAQAFNVGRALRDKALVWIVLGKSLLFMILLLLFHVAEEAIRAWFKGLPLSSSIEDFGGGTWLGLITYAAIFFVVPIPFFAFQEVAGLVGAGALSDLFFSRDRKECKFIRE